MSTKLSQTPSADGERMLISLRQAVNKALDRKRRLGQYAVIWEQGKPVIQHGDSIRVAEAASSYEPKE